jgi:hypothetical protein
MPKKGEVSPFRGTGASSRVKTETHTIYKDGRWWRTRKDWERHREKKREWRKKNPSERRRIGYGASSKEWLETHQFQKAGRYWRSEEDYKRAYNKHKLAREAAEAGLSIERYIEIRDKSREAYELSTKRSKFLKDELHRLKAKYDMKPSENRRHLAAKYVETRDPEIRNFLLLHDSVTSTSDEKITRIRNLILDGKHKPIDILYQTALIVGIAMKEKQ